MHYQLLLSRVYGLLLELEGGIHESAACTSPVLGSVWRAKAEVGSGVRLSHLGLAQNKLAKLHFSSFSTVMHLVVSMPFHLQPHPSSMLEG